MIDGGGNVVATAGHVDHGKSSLVRALTGTDPDRLVEEQERGLTIDLGFAFATLPSGAEVGFVDVPGHVRFLKNMLAGVGAVQAAVLVVAATEGWMPQTEEHLRILELLGIDRGFSVLTKADLVDPETVELARLELDDHLRGSFLEGEPVVVCDALSGRGVDDVRLALDTMVSRLPPPDDRVRPRLWIDRAFAVKGAGTVVTGTLTGGSVAEGDKLELRPAGLGVRVRGVQSGHRPVAVGRPGTRVALNLAGVEHRQVARGHALVVPGQWHQATTVDVAVTLLGSAPLPRRARLKAYVGSGEHEVALRLLDGPLARLFLDTALPLAPGDRLVLRDPGPATTVGGGEVLDVAPSGSLREAPRRLALPLPQRVLAGRGVVTIDELARLTGSSVDAAGEEAAELVRAGHARRVADAVIDDDCARRALDDVRAAVEDHHRRHPLEPGLPVSEASRVTGLDGEVIEALAVGASGLEVERGTLRLGDHAPSPRDDPAARRLLEHLAAQPFSPPSPSEIGVPAEVVRALEREGAVTTLEGVVFAQEAVFEASRRIVSALAERPLTVADVRDLLESSRRYVMPILTHLDAEGVTRRRGDLRVAGPRADQLRDASSS